MIRFRWILVLALCGCAGSSQHASASPSPPSDSYPTPYTAAQIRDASSAGRTYEWRVEAAGHPTMRRTIRFVSVAADGARIETTVRDDSGASQGAPTNSTATWDELRRHAEFPRGAVQTRDERITVPAGSFDCVVYAVTESAADGPTVTTFYFARTMPGAPVLFFAEHGGARVMTSTLVTYRSGADSSAPP